MEETENKVGRPPMYNTPEEMQEAIEAYYVKCKEDKEFVTISGLAHALGMETESLRRYEAKDEFSATVKNAKQKVEMAWEQRLLTPGSGPIFWLKNNAGWKDKSEQELSGPGGKELVVNVVSYKDKE